MTELPDLSRLETTDFLKLRTLIVGEVNTGKTTLTRRLLGRAVEKTGPARVCIVDLAPEIPEELAKKIGRKNVGGRLEPLGEGNILYLADRIEPPRLSTDTEEEAEVVAQKNRIKIERLFEAFVSSQRDIVFVNDVSLYLQAGRADDLVCWLSQAETVVINGYYGRVLGRGRLSQRERRQMEHLMEFFDQVIRL